MPTNRKPDTLMLGGVIFRFGKLVWQDAFSSYRVPVALMLDWAREARFALRETYGYYARIGDVAVVIKESGPDHGDVDITMIPYKADMRFDPK